MSPGGPEDRCTEEDARRSEDGGHVGDGSGLARERSWQAMEHAIERGGVERPMDGKWLADVGFDGRDVQAPQPPGCMIEDVHVGVEEGDRAGVREAGSFQEVASAGTHVEVPVAEVPPVSLHEASRRAPPHDRREEAKDQGVVDLEEERGVLALARRRRDRHVPSSSSGPPSSVAAARDRPGCRRQLRDGQGWIRIGTRPRRVTIAAHCPVGRGRERSDRDHAQRDSSGS